MKVIIVGGVAGGASCAARLQREAGTRKFGNVMGYKVTSGHAVIQ